HAFGEALRKERVSREIDSLDARYDVTTHLGIRSMTRRSGHCRSGRRTHSHDACFFARLLPRVRPRRALDLASGSGRVTFALAAALPMAEIVGVDSSIDMLGQAAMTRDAAEPSVRERVSLVEGDMRDWPGTGDAFDAVVIACCSVSHLLTLDDRR